MSKGTYCYHCGRRILTRGVTAAHHNEHQGERVISYSLCADHLDAYTTTRNELLGYPNPDQPDQADTIHPDQLTVEDA